MDTSTKSTGATKSRSLPEIVRGRIRARKPGSVVSPADFLSLGTRAAVDQVLSRLAKDGTLRRIRRGVYYYPRVNEQLGITLSPDPDAIAKALARGQKTEIQVAGAQAANLLGLSEQVPARVVYLTDGATGKVQVDNQTIELRHASPRSMRTAGRISGTVIQALRHLGKKNVTPEIVQRLSANLSKEEKGVLRRDLLLAPEWMRAVLSSVIEESKAKSKPSGNSTNASVNDASFEEE